MIELFRRLSTKGLHITISRRIGLALVFATLAALAIVPGNVQAQGLTTQALIGDAVDTTSLARYTDVDEAIKRFLNRDVLAARQFLDAAKKKEPNLPPVDLLLAKMYFLSGNVPAGRVSLEKTAAENPDDPEATLILADQA